jgi:hypothetical protein
VRWTLSESDFRTIEGYPFQRWGAREGAPFAEMRPLVGASAERAWRRALQLGSVDEDGALPDELYGRQARLDLCAAGEWDEATVQCWLLEHLPDRDQPVLVSYGPPWAVRVPWGSFCDHWLTFCWPDACCAWPTPGEQWVMRYDRDEFLIGWRRPARP